MIVVKEFPDKEFETKEELFKAFRENKSELYRLKKTQLKEADSVSYQVKNDVNSTVIKEDVSNNGTSNNLLVKAVINTTNLLDSHRDLHVDGIWKRSLKNNDIHLHLQEHQSKFNHIISDDAKAYTKNTTFKALGFDYEGNTQALIFDSIVSAKRNEFMYGQYKNGWVKNHSVGMRYINYILCLNSESKYDQEEKDNFDKYYPLIANKDEFDEIYYFWAVLEAQIVEGSAVVKGSCHTTPTQSVTEIEENKTETDVVTSENNESPQGTQKAEQMLKELLTKI